MESEEKAPEDGQDEQKSSDETSQGQEKSEDGKGDGDKEKSNQEPEPKQVIEDLKSSQKDQTPAHNWNPAIQELQKSRAETDRKLEDLIKLVKEQAGGKEPLEPDPLADLQDDDIFDAKAAKALDKKNEMRLKRELGGIKAEISEMIEKLSRQQQQAQQPPAMPKAQQVEEVGKYFGIPNEYAEFILEKATPDIKADLAESPNISERARERLIASHLRDQLDALNKKLEQMKDSKKGKEATDDPKASTKVIDNGASSATTVKPNQDPSLSEADAKVKLLKMAEDMKISF